jgi:hypothetical protein
MELWIRSQDKERLIQVENLYVEFNGDVDPKLQPYRIVTDKFISLGIYKDYERALEVLDEIQKILNPKGIIKFKSQLAKEDIKRIQDSFDGEFFVGDASSEIIKLGDTYVYQMPKE